MSYHRGPSIHGQYAIATIIKHYDLHSNCNEISNRVERCRRTEMYSKLFLQTFGYTLIIGILNGKTKKMSDCILLLFVLN